MSTTRRSFTGHDFLLLVIAFFGIFVYGLLTALPGSVLPTLERHKFLPDDAVAGTFLFINAIGAVVAYMVSGPIIDRVGKKFALAAGSLLVIGSMVGFWATVANVEPAAARVLIFACSLVLGLGANAIVSAGHALVADVADAGRNSALNLLDVCFGLGLMTLPFMISKLDWSERLGIVFLTLAVATIVLLALILMPSFPQPTHPESFPLNEAKDLFSSLPFWLLAIALFMYVGTEVAVGKWVVTFIQRDGRLLEGFGGNQTSAADFALLTLSFFGFSLIIGRLLSSFLLGVIKMNSYVLLTLGSLVTSVGLAIAFTASSAGAVRWAVFFSGIGMGPIFPTSVGLASVIVPKIAGTAMSWVMGIGFAGLLVIPPSVGYISSAVGGEAGDVRTGLLAVLAASIVMLLLHITLALRQRRYPAAVSEMKPAQAE